MTGRILIAQMALGLGTCAAFAETPANGPLPPLAEPVEVLVQSSLSAEDGHASFGANGPAARLGTMAAPAQPTPPVEKLPEPVAPTNVAQVQPAFQAAPPVAVSPGANTVDTVPFMESWQASPAPVFNAVPGLSQRFWTSADYMFAWMHSASVPPVLTTSPAGTSRAMAGVLGAPGTTSLFDDRVGGGLRSGLRLGAGYWFESNPNIGIEGGFLIVESQASVLSTTSNGSTILARPYTDATTGAGQAVLVAFPGSSRGSANIRFETGNFYTGNIDLTEKVLESANYRLTAMGGYRYFNYSESLAMQQSIAPTSGGFVPGTNIVSSDHFGTRNEFHGMDIGLRSEYFFSNLSLEALAKVAIGDMRSVVSINGLQTISVPGAVPVSSLGGVYALRSNIGSRVNDYFGTLPEFGLNVRYQIRPNLQFRAGYSLFLLDGIVRAGNQVTTAITPANFPPATGTGGQPSFTLDRSFFWLQSVNFGLTLTY